VKNTDAVNPQDQPQVEVVPLDDIKLDPKNANRGTPRGQKAIKRSLKNLGAGRSVLLDKNQTAIAGNKTIQEAKRQGYKEVLVVRTSGDQLVAVQRTDLDLKDKKAQELAISDNFTSAIDLSWDPEILANTDVDLAEVGFDPIEVDNITNAGRGHKRTDKIDKLPPPKMLWILLGIPFDRFDLIQEPLAAIEAESEITVQQSRDKKPDK